MQDASSCTAVSFLPYIPPRHGADPDPLWIEAIQELDYDLHWLLKQSHPNFWSQVFSYEPNWFLTDFFYR